MQPERSSFPSVESGAHRYPRQIRLSKRHFFVPGSSVMSEAAYRGNCAPFIRKRRLATVQRRPLFLELHVEDAVFLQLQRGLLNCRREPLALASHARRYLAMPRGLKWGCRTFRAKSGALILKIRIGQVFAKSLIARKLPNGQTLLQAALRAATVIFARNVR